MSRNARISAAILAAFAVAVGIALIIDRLDGASTSSTKAGGASLEQRVVRSDSHRLGEAGDATVQFVEFLDFECESCRAAFPAVEQLRKTYQGRVEFVVRYFPLPGHFNGERAARAVEAAAQQGKFEAMYQRMYQTQSQWGERKAPADATFRTLASELGLDMAAFDKAYKDPATTERINKDVADGRALGVTSTPTFFVDGKKIQPESYQDLTASIDAALSR